MTHTIRFYFFSERYRRRGTRVIACGWRRRPVSERLLLLLRAGDGHQTSVEQHLGRGVGHAVKELHPDARGAPDFPLRIEALAVVVNAIAFAILREANKAIGRHTVVLFVLV